MHSPFAHHWDLDPDVTFLNHGSFGACPRAVLAEQLRLRAEMESEPVRFMVERLEPLLDEARREVAWFVGAREQDLVFVPNATAGVNAVVRSMELSPGDELLTINHAYNACVNVLRYVGERTGAKVVVADVERFPRSGEAFVDAFLKHANERTRLVMVCHVTSPTALVLPVKRIVEELAKKWPRADVLIDGAHAPGMLEVDVSALGAAYYTANCHKWMCSPKGAAFLHVREDRQACVRPHVISHGANSQRKDRSRFQIEFDWTGTDDPSAILCVPAAIRTMAGIWEGRDRVGGHPEDGKPVGRDEIARAWAGIRERNRNLVLEGRRLIARVVGGDAEAALVPDEMVGCLAAVALPDGVGATPAVPTGRYPDPLQRWLVSEKRVQVPVSWFPAWPRRSVRLSAQLHNAIGDYERLGECLREGRGLGSGC
jgi:isopenicillin-N epimerase